MKKLEIEREGRGGGREEMIEVMKIRVEIVVEIITISDVLRK